MAESGRKTEQSGSAINKGSAEDYDHTCDPCSTDGQHVEAHGYCVECQDYLCITCFRSHSKSRASRHHELLDKSASVPRNISKVPPDTCTEKCSKHGREIIKFFCPEHEALGCNDCMVLDHRTCKIDYIPDRCTDFASGNDYKRSLEELDSLLKKASNIQKMADAKTRKVDQFHRKIEEEIDIFQTKINDRIAELRNRIIDEMNRKGQTKKEEISKVMQTCKQVETDAKRLQRDANNSISTNRDGQLFISVKRAEHLLKSQEIIGAEAALEEIVLGTAFRRNKDMENLFHSQTVLGTLSSIREPDAICRNVRNAVITKVIEKPIISAAINIGSTHTGYGFSVAAKPLVISIPSWRNGGNISRKAPTAVLINPDHSLCAFGYEAIGQYRELVEREEHQDYYFFESFITALYQKTEEKATYIEDVTKKKMSPVHVLSLLVRFIKDRALAQITSKAPGGFIQDDVHWTITVPERFVTAKAVMKEAAQQAGIVSKNLTVAFETEAAFSYLQKLVLDGFERSPEIYVAQFQEGTKYLVLDAGEALVTSTVYEVGKCKSTQLFHASLESSGGRNVNDEFEKFLSRLFGNDVLQNFKKCEAEDFEEMMHQIEVKKTSTLPERSKETLRVSVRLFDHFRESTGKSINDRMFRQPFQGKVKLYSDKVGIDAALFQNLFKQSIETIVNHLNFVLHDDSTEGCNVIVMVGAFSESPMLQDGVMKAFPHLKVMVPQMASLAVMKGAVILGHSLIH